MFKNLLTVAIRSLLKQRFYSILNLTGLALGIGVFLIISLIIAHQLSYDKFHANYDRIYRIDQTFIWGDAYPTFGSTGPGVAASVHANVPGVAHVARVYTIGERVVSAPDRPQVEAFEEQGILGVDSMFLSIFTFPLLHGDDRTALHAPKSAVITSSTAKKYFGQVNAVGKVLKIGNNCTDCLYQVTGVTDDVPTASHFTFDILLSMASFPEVAARSTTWFWSGFVTYALLAEDASEAVAREVLYDMPSQYAGNAYENVTSGGKEWHLYLQPLGNIWLHTVDSPNRLGATGNITYVYILMAIAVMVVLLAVVNYTNMATARSLKRAKEVGIRKVMGALKSQLHFQFLAESFLIVILAAVLGMVLVELSAPLFSDMAGVELSVFYMFESKALLLIVIATVVGTSLLAGMYPAFFMSQFAPIQALRKHGLRTSSGQVFRGGLVVFQFVISISLVVLSMLVYDQLSYLQNKDLGFDKDNLIIVPNTHRLDSTRRASFQQAVANNPVVAAMATSTSVPPNVWDGDSFVTEENATSNIPLSYMHVSKSYLQTIGVELGLGRLFQEVYENNGHNVLLNEAAVVALGWTSDESVLGKKLIYHDKRFSVIGVLKDFHYRTLDGPIEPLAVFQFGAPIYHRDTRYMTVKLTPQANNLSDVQGFLASLESSWDEFAPGLPFSYQFTDQEYFRAFEFEQRIGSIFTIFTALALAIACLGLIGLAAYMAEVRTKEIGIRKVLGATVSEILMLMGRDFAKLVAIAYVLAIPLSWYVGNKWLQNYEYRTVIDWRIFIFAGLGAFLIAIISVSYQSIKSAHANPADVLHDE